MTIELQKGGTASGEAKPGGSRTEILKASARLFRDRGYAASTLRDIAEATGIKAGSIYYHFESKDQILDQILDQGLRDIYDGVRSVIERSEDSMDYRTRIGSAIHAHLTLLLAHSEFTATYIRVYSQLPEEVRDRQQPLRRAYAKLWQTLLRDAQNAGQVRGDVKIIPLQQFLVGALNWTVMWFDVKRHSVNVLADRCTKLFLDGIASEGSIGETKDLISVEVRRIGSGSRITKSDRTRQEILRAAARLFRVRGYAASTLRNIADAADMKAGSIYYHFDSKSELLNEILEQGLREIHDGVRKALSSERGTVDPRTKIAAAVHAHLTLLLTSSEFTATGIRVFSQLPDQVRDRQRPMRRAYAKLWETILQEAQEAGQLRGDIKIVPLRQFLLGALNWTVEWFDRERFSVDSLAVLCTKLILDGIYVKSSKDPS